MRVVAALSGGVDSSVAAFKLKEQGHDVIGVTIKTWPKEECGASGEKMCCSLEAIQYARSAAEDLDIPFYVVDFSKEFNEIVKKYFVEEYSKGKTPNPCVYCNSRIKFGYLFEKAKELGAEKIATGHYARILKDGEEYFLREASDLWQDQSYFLFDIPRDTLKYIEFPLGELSKDEVRHIAYDRSLMSAGRKASQDICFAMTEGGYREYILKAGASGLTPGDIIDTSGKVVGRHKGIASYTVGQRKGLGVAGPEPFYVIKIDAVNNTVIIGTKDETMKKKIKVSGFNWIILDKLSEPRVFNTRIRYNGDKHEALVTPSGNEKALVEFKEPLFAPTPGQAAVFYEDNIVAGGGWIEEVLD